MIFYADRFGIALSLTVCLFFAAGCSRAPQAPPAGEAPGAAGPGRMAFSDEHVLSVSPEYIRKYQPDIRLSATWNNGWIEVRAKNKSGKPIAMAPGNFGVLIENQGGRGGSRKIVPAKPPEARAYFPTADLEPEGVASGWFQFPKLGNLEGQYLVFLHPDPDIRPSRCRIEPKPDSAPNL